MGKTYSANSFYFDDYLNFDSREVLGESISGTSGTLSHYPVVPGSVVLTNGTQTYIDIGVIESNNGAGVLVSTVSSHSGTINYTNGTWTVTAWEGSGSETADYLAVALSPSLVSINWDGLLYPTIKCLGHFNPISDHYYANEIGTLRDTSIWTGIEEYSKYVDLLQLIPEKFRSSIALQQLLYVLGLQVGTWIGEINDLQTILDKWSVGPNYIQFLADLVGWNLIITPTTTYAEMQQQLLQIPDWYKQNGTYQALKVVGYTLGLNLNIQDLYTQDYVNFVPEPWYTGPVGTNPPGLSNSYYKSPHFGIAITLNTVYPADLSNPYPYLWNGSLFTPLSQYVERVRPINTVPQYSLLLTGQTVQNQTTVTLSGDVMTATQSVWNPSLTLFDGNPVTNEYIGSSNNTSGTLLQHPIVPGSVILTNGYQTYIDIGVVESTNGAGILVSSVSSFYDHGTINYTTGVWTVPGWGGSGIETADYLAIVHFDYPNDVSPDYFFDSIPTAFYNSIVTWKLGTGNKGVDPSTHGFALQNVVLTGSIPTPTIYPDYVSYSFSVPINTTQSGLSELGLYLLDGAIEVGCTFPDISIVSGVQLQVIINIYFTSTTYLVKDDSHDQVLDDSGNNVIS